MDESAQLALALDAATTSWNPRFVAYAQAHGNTPEEQSREDDARWPCGRMCGFLCWSSARCAEWKRLRKLKPDAPIDDQDGYTRWLLGGAPTWTDA